MCKNRLDPWFLSPYLFSTCSNKKKKQKKMIFCVQHVCTSYVHDDIDNIVQLFKKIKLRRRNVLFSKIQREKKLVIFAFGNKNCPSRALKSFSTLTFLYPTKLLKWIHFVDMDWNINYGFCLIISTSFQTRRELFSFSQSNINVLHRRKLISRENRSNSFQVHTPLSNMKFHWSVGFFSLSV